VRYIYVIVLVQEMLDYFLESCNISTSAITSPVKVITWLCVCM